MFLQSVKKYIARKFFPEYIDIETCKSINDIVKLHLSHSDLPSFKNEENTDVLDRSYQNHLSFEKINKIKSLAKENRWDFIGTQKTPPMISFKKKGMRINIYYTQMTVVTALEHPHAGKRQLVRRKVSMSLLNQIFINPRIHTGRGYYRKQV